MDRPAVNRTYGSVWVQGMDRAIHFDSQQYIYIMEYIYIYDMEMYRDLIYSYQQLIFNGCMDDTVIWWYIRTCYLPVFGMRGFNQQSSMLVFDHALGYLMRYRIYNQQHYISGQVSLWICGIVIHPMPRKSKKKYTNPYGPMDWWFPSPNTVGRFTITWKWLTCKDIGPLGRSFHIQFWHQSRGKWVLSSAKVQFYGSLNLKATWTFSSIYCQK